MSKITKETKLSLDLGLLFGKSIRCALNAWFKPLKIKGDNSLDKFKIYSKMLAKKIQFPKLDPLSFKDKTKNYENWTF